MPGTETHEYAFDVTLMGLIRVNAASPEEAATKLREAIDAATVNAGVWEDTGDPIVFEASIEGSMDLFEIDGETTDILETCF